VRAALVSLLGVPLFLWPFLHLPLPAGTPALALALAAAGALAVLELGTRRLEARGLAALAALVAMATALRLTVVEGVSGFNPMFFLVLCAGWTFGASYGFLVGAFSILVSSLVESGVGPWLPYQVFATGWVGMAAGLAARASGGPGLGPPGWPSLLLLTALGLVSGWVFGALMDVQTWVSAASGGSSDLWWRPGLDTRAALLRFGRFYLATSLAYDTFRSAGNALLLLLLGPPVLAALARLRARLSFEVLRS
jgi:energy-coupling factor transport system substrate-specific component